MMEKKIVVKEVKPAPAPDLEAVKSALTTIANVAISVEDAWSRLLQDSFKRQVQVWG